MKISFDAASMFQFLLAPGTGEAVLFMRANLIAILELLDLVLKLQTRIP